MGFFKDFKEDLSKTIGDDTLYSFENNEFAGNWKSLNIPMIPPNEVVMEGLVFRQNYI